jgi:glycosyltransferase involved in cell wall biosynthesis
LILITGFVGEQELDNLYKNASLFVFPSLYEGFGLPPLEAMKRGIPVASSNATCLPEILGDAAIYFNPSNVDDMVEKIKRALVDRELRERLIKKGFEQIQKYSWQKMARETLEIYKKST